MIRYDAIVGLAVVKVLNQVVPDMPFPNDIAAGWSGRVHFDKGVGPQLAGGQKSGVASRGNRLGRCLGLPRDHQDVAIGQFLDVVMDDVVVRVVVKLPGNCSIPGDALDASGSAARGKSWGAK